MGATFILGHIGKGKRAKVGGEIVVWIDTIIKK
jgi:hypothetical protein